MRALRNMLFPVLLCAVSIPAFAQPPAPPAETVDPAVINVREMASAQTARYGRELYNKGDLPGSIKVFRSIIEQDCNNTIAQYHLQKIAERSPEYKYLTAYLKALPCPMKDFNKEDFLPSSLYYEKDPAMLLEQLALYNKRYIAIRNSTNAKIDQYARAAGDLEKQVDELGEALSARAENSAKTIGDMKVHLALARDNAKRMDDEVSSLKGQLAQATVTRNRATLYPDRDGQPGLAQANAALDASRDDLGRQDLQLTGLRAKFAAIQERLKAIEQNLVQKNTQLETVQENIVAIKK